LNRNERDPHFRLSQGYIEYDFGEDSLAQDHVSGNSRQGAMLSKTSFPLNLNIGVLIPARNEEKNIENVISRLRNLGFENILVIDGGSTDRTHMISLKNGAKVVSQIGLGKGNAVRQALSEGYFDVDALVLMDADGSMAPEEIPAFIDVLAAGADVVKGSRFMKGGNTYDMTLNRRIGNSLMLISVNLLFSTKYTDLCYGFAVLSRRAIQELAPILKSENFEIETELFIKAAEIGLNVKEVPSVEFKRKNGTSNLNAIRDGLRIFVAILKEFINY
jgi:glycosyltransferase involved in cell wall biosynthesis